MRILQSDTCFNGNGSSSIAMPAPAERWQSNPLQHAGQAATKPSSTAHEQQTHLVTSAMLLSHSSALMSEKMVGLIQWTQLTTQYCIFWVGASITPF